MPPSQPPKDALGNDLHEGDLITMVADKPLFFRIMKLDNGGLQTPQGMTPATVIVGVTITLRAIPNQPIFNIARVVSPGNEQYVKSLLDAS